MNTQRNGMPQVPASPYIDEHDWQLQQDALATGADRRDALLARALATMPVSQPPPGFAAEVARRAAVGVQVPAAEEPAFERALLNLLAWVLAVAALGAVAFYGGQWTAQLRGVLGDAAAMWLFALVACAGVSWLIGGIRSVMAADEDAGFARNR